MVLSIGAKGCCLFFLEKDVPLSFVSSRAASTAKGHLSTLQSERKMFSPDHAEVATSCAPNTSKTDKAAQSGLRGGFRGCRQRGKLRPLRWSPPGCCFADLFAGGREVARAAQAQGFTGQAWNTTFDARRLNLCRSAIRARLKRDIRLGKVLAVCLAPPCGTTLMRDQRVALALFAFCAKHGIPTALVQPSCISPLGRPTSATHSCLVGSRGSL